MKSPIVSYVGWLLLLSALGFYGYGIYEAIRISWGDGTNGAYPDALATTIGSIQALLLANLGILLGISIARPNSSVAKQLALGTRNTQGFAPEDPLEMKEKVQLAGAVVFILGLIACLIAWIKDGFSSDSTELVPVISESGKMFIAVILAYLTAALGGSTQKTGTTASGFNTRRFNASLKQFTGDTPLTQNRDKVPLMVKAAVLHSAGEPGDPNDLPGDTELEDLLERQEQWVELREFLLKIIRFFNRSGTIDTREVKNCETVDALIELVQSKING